MLRQQAGVECDPSADEREHALGAGQGVDGNAEDVAREHGEVRQHAGRERSLLQFGVLGERARPRVRHHGSLAKSNTFFFMLPIYWLSYVLLPDMKCSMIAPRIAGFRCEFASSSSR